jgi:tRNA nucleotidyltransferase (CCA-adding enzyme)
LDRTDLALDGHVLMAELGIAPGRVVGELLEALLEIVTDEPERNERAALLDAARELLRQREGR